MLYDPGASFIAANNTDIHENTFLHSPIKIGLRSQNARPYCLAW